MNYLTIADRCSIAHLCAEQGALLAYFPLDDLCLNHFCRIGKFSLVFLCRQWKIFIWNKLGRDSGLIENMRDYLISAKLFNDGNQSKNIVYTEVCEFDLSIVVPNCSGPKRAQDKVCLNSMKSDFRECLTAPMGFKVMNLTKRKLSIYRISSSLRALIFRLIKWIVQFQHHRMKY